MIPGVLQGQVLVGGNSCQGRINCRPQPKERGFIFLTRRLTIEDYPIIRRCRAVICEEGGIADHPAVICRIIGIPVLLLQNGTAALRHGEVVTVDIAQGIVRQGSHPFRIAPSAADMQLALTLKDRDITLQLAVVDEHDIGKANRRISPYPIGQFFVREELLWVKHARDPLLFLADEGPQRIKPFLQGELMKCLQCMKHDQLLNFRALDMRSDARITVEDITWKAEQNPELGLHGIRMLLKYPELLIGELTAVDALYAQGFENIIFTLPFICESEELAAVHRIAAQCCTHPIKFGIFIETPAAVSELPFLLDMNVAMVYIGTKDLTQTIMAADRNNEAVRHIYSCRKRPVQKAITAIIDACREASTPVVVFALYEDLPFFLEDFAHIQSISICAAEYERLCVIHGNAARAG
jgi:phosphoenolpyruvate-protein kinase (PTS system EI component)